MSNPLRPLASLAMAAAILLAGGTARAVTIELRGPAAVTVGQSVDYEFFVSGLGNGVPPSVGQFQATLSWASGRFQFDAISFGDPGLGDQLALVDAPLTGASPGATFVFFSEDYTGAPSAALAAQLDAAQAPAFVLATVSLTALSAGSASFQIFSTVLEQPRESFLVAPVDIPFTTTIPMVTVTPEPGLAALLLLVAAAASVRGRRRPSR